MQHNKNHNPLNQLLNYHNKKHLKNEDIYINAYNNRNFALSHIIKLDTEILNQYQHIKQTTKSYLILDIDNIDNNKVFALFHNSLFTPNFYIYEFSKNKQCYTLQVFILLDKEHIINENFINNYKKLCHLFGADLNYQLKTGIHKNPDYYDLVEINQNDIQIQQKNHTGFLHMNDNNFNNIIDNLEKLKSELVFFGISQEPEKNADIKKVIKVKAINADSKKISEKNNVGDRNITLFNSTRLIAYSIKDKSLDNILHIAKKVNSGFKIPLKQAEVLKTAKSIFNYCNNVLTDKTKSDPYSEYQRQLSIETRHNKARLKIIDAIKQLKLDNKEITQTAVRKITKQELTTIKNNFDYCLKYVLNQENPQKTENKNIHYYEDNREFNYITQQNNNYEIEKLINNIAGFS